MYKLEIGIFLDECPIALEDYFFPMHIDAGNDNKYYTK